MAAFKLDLRFADEEDSGDIASLINECGATDDYRVAGSAKIEAGEVEGDCASSKSRWIVLETAAPEEAVVACVRLRMLLDKAEEELPRRAVLDLLTAKEHSSVSAAAVFNQLLARVEGIARGLGVQVLTVETVQWDEAAYDWLTSAGYTDVAGRPSTAAFLTKPCMVLELQKNLASEGAAAPHDAATAVGAVAGAADLPVDLAALLDGIDLSAEASTVTATATATATADNDADAPGAGSMEGLVASLFSALHREYPEA